MVAYPIVDYIDVRNYGAVGDGSHDDTAAFTSAVSAATGTLAPATNTRVAVAPVYVPSGTYKVTSDILIQSVSGFRFFGDGPGNTIIKAAGGGFTTAVLNIDGSADGIFEGFDIRGDGSEQVTNGINLTWTTAAARSTTGNRFSDIRVRTLKSVTGFSMAGIGTRQVDGTQLENVIVTGGQTPGAWSNSGNWQKGFEFGNGSFGNIYDQVMTRCDAGLYYNGYYCNDSAFALYGAQPAANAIDFFINPNGQITVENIQSQGSGQFCVSGANSQVGPVSFRDVQFVTTQSTSVNWISILGAGASRDYLFENVTNNSFNYSPVVSVGSSGGAAGAMATFVHFAQNNTLAAGFAVTGTAQLVAVNYQAYNAQTGVSAEQHAVSIYTAGSWADVSATGVPPGVTWLNTAGVTSWPVPANTAVVDVFLHAGGSGGGSGCLAAAGAAGGGGGGGAGGFTRMAFPAADLTSPVSVTVGAGGAGGTAISVAGNGNNGTAGTLTSFGSYLYASAGTRGNGGTAAAGGTGGTGGGGNVANGGSGGAGNATSTGGVGAQTAASSGGGGGAGTTGAATANGGATQIPLTGPITNTAAGGVAGGASPGTGTAPATRGTPSCGGGGGASSITTTGQAGATPFLGAGGGGGGACSAGTASGAGGAGADGFALIIARFA